MTSENIQYDSIHRNDPNADAWDEWLMQLDFAGPFAELKELAGLLAACPNYSMAEARQLRGLIDARRGRPNRCRHDPEYDAGWTTGAQMMRKRERILDAIMSKSDIPN
ncbi:hypothetical protein [Magnetospirillum fulvum]|uniref:Uncharacterized protein n=1 Tax=Magnetospirillum fulvum MGU-K5 TaxID=1316936 RepID=S9TX35_MAGFU|nr:hypothetical protein [Magnetospirillum fulvum]EPY02960.1 hypothetical protein K678_03527 [Magnetospirillum fulvum MGU-K5]